MNHLLAKFYKRDLRKLIDEINLFNNEEDIWKTHGSIKNSSGNLVLHIIGGMNHHIGATLAKTGYVRNRDEEFAAKGVDRKILVVQLEALILLVNNTLLSLSPAQIDDDFPVPFDGAKKSNSYVLTQLLLHLNYHLGQVNYLRRMLE